MSARETIDRLATEYISVEPNHGLAIGLVRGETTEARFYGSSGVDTRPLDEETVFETGSIGKVFTGNLLATMVSEGRVALDDPIEKYLPPEVNAPTYFGRSITLEHLATHTSALPRLPLNMLWTIEDTDDPYANYTTEDLYRYLSRKRLWRRPGTRVKYSNLGMGLLGDLLGLADGCSYEESLTRRVFEPLGMTDTTITLSEEQQDRVAQGHNEKGDPVPLWTSQCLQGDGAHRSTMRDLLTYAAANLQEDGALADELQMCHQPRAGGSVPLPAPRWRYTVAVLFPVLWLLWYGITAFPGRLSHPLAITLLAALTIIPYLFGGAAGILNVLLIFGGMFTMHAVGGGAGPLWAGMQIGVLEPVVVFGALAWALSSRFRRNAGLHVGLAWHRSPLTDDGPDVIWHNGGTGGFATFVGLVKETRTAVIVLSNSANCVDELAIEALRALQPLSANAEIGDNLPQSDVATAGATTGQTS